MRVVAVQSETPVSAITRNRRAVRRTAIVTAILLMAGACSSDAETSSTEPPTTEPPVPTAQPVEDPLATLAPGESIVFEVEVTITESTDETFGAVGDVIWMPNCYPLTAPPIASTTDGAFLDPGFLRSDRSELGTWTSEWDGTTATYAASVSSGPLSLEQAGLVTVDEATGKVLLTADSAVALDGRVRIRARSVGQAVTDCEPVEGTLPP
jgi:hypothetical protein